jgi:uncharacterized protein (TIGR03437 family)
VFPLFFVSERQINALVPSDFQSGEYRLTVRSAGQPDVSATFQVARNAPGLFANWIESVAYASAFHADGRLLLPENPARPGETIKVLATGLGPFAPSPLDGFAVPAGGGFPLVDAVEVLLDDMQLSPVWVRAAEGLVGTAAILIQIPEGLHASGSARLRVRINNRDSNSVNLSITY